MTRVNYLTIDEKSFHPSKEGFKGYVGKGTKVDKESFHPSKEGFKVPSHSSRAYWEEVSIPLRKVSRERFFFGAGIFRAGFHPSKEGFKDFPPSAEYIALPRFHPSKEGFKGIFTYFSF